MIVRKDAMITKLNNQIEDGGFESLYGSIGRRSSQGDMRSSRTVATSLEPLAHGVLTILRNCGWLNVGMFNRQDRDVPFPLPAGDRDAYGLALYNPRTLLDDELPGSDEFGPEGSFGLRVVVVGISESDPSRNEISLISTIRQRRGSDKFAYTRMNRYGSIDAGLIIRSGENRTSFSEELTLDAKEQLPRRLEILVQYLHGVARSRLQAYSAQVD